jgi:hypothetical protein
MSNIVKPVMEAIVKAIKPVLLRFLNSKAVRQLVVDLLDAYAKTTDNKIDDGLVDLVASALGLEE